MLAPDAWKQHEPRFGFPTFKGMRTFVSFSIRSDFRPMNLRGIANAGLWTLRKRGAREFAHFAREYAPLALAPFSGGALEFRLIVTSREGKMLGVHRVPGRYPPGGAVDLDATAIIADMGLPEGDYMAIMVMTRGRADGFRSSPGSYSMTYAGPRTYSTYRTGGFARALNEPRRKSHHGFRGINPKALATETHLSSILLVNHSSNPRYDATVRPSITLLRSDGAAREADFGPIPPFGGVERNLEELFGPDAADFLRLSGGRGTTLATCPGVTLASLHLLRARDGSTFSIEHSRPSHTYLLNGVGKL